MTSWRRIVPVAVAALTVAAASPSDARAQTLYYGGDINPALNHNSGINLLLAHAPNQLVFDNFAVAGQPWLVTSVFANINVAGTSPMPSTLSWELRTGMVPNGSVGTVVAGGSGAYSVNGDTFTIPVSPFTLGPGTYWLAIYGDYANITAGFGAGVYTTFGANAFDAIGDGAGILLIGADDSNVGGTSDPLLHDYSYGVNGVLATATPEPATWAMLGAGLLALGAVGRRRGHATGD